MPKRTSDSLSERVSDPDRVGLLDERAVVATFMHPDPRREEFAHEFDAIEWPAPVRTGPPLRPLLPPSHPSH